MLWIEITIVSLTIKENLAESESTDMGTSLAVQWLRLCASTAGAVGLIPGWGTKIPRAAQCGPTKKKKKRRINRYLLSTKLFQNLLGTF